MPRGRRKQGTSWNAQIGSAVASRRSALRADGCRYGMFFKRFRLASRSGRCSCRHVGTESSAGDGGAAAAVTDLNCPSRLRTWRPILVPLAIASWRPAGQTCKVADRLGRWKDPTSCRRQMSTRERRGPAPRAMLECRVYPL